MNFYWKLSAVTCGSAFVGLPPVLSGHSWVYPNLFCGVGTHGPSGFSGDSVLATWQTPFSCQQSLCLHFVFTGWISPQLAVSMKGFSALWVPGHHVQAGFWLPCKRRALTAGGRAAYLLWWSKNGVTIGSLVHFSLRGLCAYFEASV